MVKTRGVSKKDKSFKKRTDLESRKSDNKVASDKKTKRNIPNPIKKKEKGFFSKLFGGNSKKSVEKINTIKIKPSKNKKSIRLKPEAFFKPQIWKNHPKGRSVKPNLSNKKVADKTPDKKLKKVIKNLKEEFYEKKLRSQEKGTGKKLRENFMKTGISGFDSLFEKNMGIPNGNSILIEGGPGSGKTIFCLATLNELCKKGKKCLYMSFEESEEQLIMHMEEFGWKPKEFIKKGLLKVERFDAIDISRSIEALLSAAKKELLIEVEPMFFPEDFNPDFVVIDSLTSIASAFTGEESRFRIYMEQLFRYLEKNNITNFLIREVSSPSHVGTIYKEQGEAVSFLSDGIIVLYNVVYDSGERTFAIEILKMRGVSFKHKIVEFKIVNKKGLEVNPNKILKKSHQSNFSLT